MMQGEGIQASFDVKMKERRAGADRIALVLLQCSSGTSFQAESAITATADWGMLKLLLFRAFACLQLFTHEQLTEE